MSTELIDFSVPEGWSIQKKRKAHLEGQHDKSKMLEEEIGDNTNMSEEEYAFWCECKESEEDEEEMDYADDGKKYTHTYTDSKTGKKRKVRYGAKGYSISPGTKKGDSYCARSYGDMKSEGMDCSGADKNTPMCLSRKKWKCKGKKSSK